MRSNVLVLIASLTLAGCATVSGTDSGLDLAALPKLTEVDERFQSYNVEMVEVTGGRFWAPYHDSTGGMYQMRPPIDLANPKLRRLAQHLAPAFVRVSGTWANNSYIPAEGERLSVPPAGYKQILTPEQWHGVVAFAKAVDAPIVTSFAASEGTRNSEKIWKPDQAQRLVDLTRQGGGTLYAAEFFNEPNIPMAGGLPKGYSAADYARDFRIFRDWARRAAPKMKIIGPGSLGEGVLFASAPAEAAGFLLDSADMMRGDPGSLDAVSYHHYGAVSQRCANMNVGIADKAAALSPEWLDRTAKDFDFYAALRDRYAPGKPIWLTETAQAACGGSPWAASFLDSFRYLNQLGLLAQKGVQVVMHNTLAASDYALLDEDTLEPRPSYWAAILWKRTMGRIVLAAPRSPSPDLRLYAHCLPDRKGGVGLLALNLQEAPQKLPVDSRGMAWVMTGKPLDTKSVRINGHMPMLGPNGDIKGLEGVPAGPALVVPGQSIAFLAVKDANNSVCR